MKLLGRIYGDAVWGNFRFVSDEYVSERFVCVVDDYNDNSALSAIYRVTECRARNKYFDSPEAILYLRSTEDVSKDTLFTYEATLIAALNDGHITDRIFPLFPGKPVYEAGKESISLAYGIKPEGALVGHMLNAANTEVRLSLDDVFNPHMVILGRTGSGKSFFAKGMLRLLEREDYSVIVFSPSSEYNGGEADAGNNLPVVAGEDVVLECNPETISYLWGLNATEEKLLAGVIRSDADIYTSAVLVQEIIRRYEQVPVAKQASLFDDEPDKPGMSSMPPGVLSLISKIRKRNLRFTYRRGSMSKLRESRVIDMSHMSQAEQECLLHVYLYRLLFMQRGASPETRKKLVVFIEEAHNYVPGVRSTMCKDTIVRVAREGRKFDISLCFITQRPTHFDQTALSQAGNKFIFSLPHPDDVKKVLEDATHYSEDLNAIIRGQTKGQCTVNGDAYRSAFTFMVAFDSK